MDYIHSQTELIIDHDGLFRAQNWLKLEDITLQQLAPMFNIKRNFVSVHVCECMHKLLSLSVNLSKLRETTRSFNWQGIQSWIMAVKNEHWNKIS